MNNYSWGPFKKRPNILLLMTDQQRRIRHFPEGWAEKNLPGLTWLKNNGINFTNAYINTSPCTPSRGILFTGLYQSKTGAWVIGDSLPYNIKTMGSMMKKKGYQVVYKGKWHLDYSSDRSEASRPPDPGIMREENQRMEKSWDFPAWTSPDAASGTAPDPDKGDECQAALLGRPAEVIPPWTPGDPPNHTNLNTLGGATGNNDGRYVNGPPPDQKKYFPDQESAVDFLKKWKPGEEKPFFMVVSLVNPHDISTYPNTYIDGGYSPDAIKGKAYKDFKLPENYNDSLSTKPTIQKEFKEALINIADVKVNDPHQSLDTLKFYAYLHTLPDQLTVDLIDTLREKNLLDDTLIVRTADHGEMTTSHKLRSKCYNMYQETVNIPMIFSNPKLVAECFNGKPAETQSPVGLVDLMPTLASIAGWTKEEPENDIYLQGIDFSETVLHPDKSTQDCVLYSYQAKSPYAEPDPISNNIRAIFAGTWKYGVYYNAGPDPEPQYEMYNLENDPAELHNRLFDPNEEDIKKAEEMYEKLTKALKRTDMAPPTWDQIPPYKKWTP